MDEGYELNDNGFVRSANDNVNGFNIFDENDRIVVDNEEAVIDQSPLSNKPSSSSSFRMRLRDMSDPKIQRILQMKEKFGQNLVKEDLVDEISGLLYLPDSQLDDIIESFSQGIYLLMDKSSVDAIIDYLKHILKTQFPEDLADLIIERYKFDKTIYYIYMGIKWAIPKFSSYFSILFYLFSLCRFLISDSKKKDVDWKKELQKEIEKRDKEEVSRKRKREEDHEEQEDEEEEDDVDLSDPEKPIVNNNIVVANMDDVLKEDDDELTDTEEYDDSISE